VVVDDDDVAIPPQPWLDSLDHAASNSDLFPYAVHTVQFVSSWVPVASGDHTITVRWRVDDEDVTFSSVSRTLSVIGF
jgi:hypothetical protein